MCSKIGWKCGTAAGGWHARGRAFNRGLQAATDHGHGRCRRHGPADRAGSLGHRNLGVFTDSFSTTVPAHGAMLVKVGGQARPDVASFEGLMVGPPPAALKFDPFYEKYADAYGIPIIAGKVVEDTALLVARDIVNYMLLKRPDVRAEMVRQNYRVGIIGRDQGQTDLPEYRDYKKPAIDDRRLTTPSASDTTCLVASLRTDQEY